MVLYTSLKKAKGVFDAETRNVPFKVRETRADVVKDGLSEAVNLN